MNSQMALEFINENDIKFIRLQTVNIFGKTKNIAVTAKQFAELADIGFSFDGASVYGFSDVTNSDLILVPDFSTVKILPWRPQQGKVARVLCDVKCRDGSDFEGDSRYVLRKQVQRAQDMGYDIKIGTECEFFLLKTDDDGQPSLEPHDQASYFDVAPFDLGENIRREICLTLEQMGFHVEASHHESAPGQNEIDFMYDSALKEADDVLTFKNVVKTIAQRNGLYASFMPKLFEGKAGSGMHINFSLFQNGVNLFSSEDDELNPLTQKFTAGLLKRACEVSLVTNTLVNSYKRLNTGFEAPNMVSFGKADRSSLVRFPFAQGKRARVEFRSPDPACNVYLAFSLLIAAGLDGIKQNIDLSSFSEGELLPANLDEAIRIAEDSTFMKEVLGEHLYNQLVAFKKDEWNAYVNTVHKWEIDNYLSTF